MIVHDSVCVCVRGGWEDTSMKSIIENCDWYITYMLYRFYRLITDWQENIDDERVRTLHFGI